MTKHRFLVVNRNDKKEPESFNITDQSQIHQIRKVLRLAAKDKVDLIDGLGNLYLCEIQSIDKNNVSLSVLEKSTEAPSNRPNLNVASAIIKNDRFEWLIQKLTEVGVDRITPIYTERTVLKSKKVSEAEFTESNKYARWMSTAREATEQSERFRPPQIESPIEFEHFLKCLGETKSQGGKSNLKSMSFICVAREAAPPLVELLLKHCHPNASQTIPLSDIQIIIGPEGGFTQSEIDSAINQGCIPCNLGKTILRSETAAIAAAYLVTSFGEL